VDNRDDPRRPTLDYSSPVAHPRQSPTRRRLGLGIVASFVHFGVGLLAVAASGGSDPYVSYAVVAFLFPFGLVAISINPHQMLAAAVGNSIVCGFAFAYAYAFWRHRTAGT
jgi:hypothetical protein